VSDINASMTSAHDYYPYAEGIDVQDHELFFISKKTRTMFILNLDTLTYTKVSTRTRSFDGQPDQIVSPINSSSSTLYFNEEANTRAGIHGRNSDGKYFTVMEGDSFQHETTGLAFSPDKKHMYVAFQTLGYLFDITRTDFETFDGPTLRF
jgi:hypothetical protein